MSEQNQTPLRKWLAEREMSIADMARQMDWQYVYTANIVSGIRPVTDRFRWRFGEVFGFDEAQRVLAPDHENEVAQ